MYSIGDFSNIIFNLDSLNEIIFITLQLNWKRYLIPSTLCLERKKYLLHGF